MAICKRCSQPIQYKTLCGIRVYTTDQKGRRQYESHCGCGKVMRRA